MINYEKSEGIPEWIAVKAGDGNDFTDFSTQFTTNLVTLAHAAGLKVYAWVYAYGGGSPAPATGSTVAGEIAVAEDALAVDDASGLPPDGLIIDWGPEYESLGDSIAVMNASQYCQAIRDAYPGALLAQSANWNPGQPDLPDVYRTFNQYCDAAMPQAYSSTYAAAAQPWLQPVFRRRP